MNETVNIVTVVICMRVACAGLFLYSFVTIHLTLSALLTLLLFLASIYIPRVVKAVIESRKQQKEFTTKQILAELYPLVKPEVLEQDVANSVAAFVTYDAEIVKSLDNFNVIKQNTECIFAKKSRLWGSKEWSGELSLEENIHRLSPMILKFSMMCRQHRLDGFVIECFADTLRRVLQVLSDLDPKGSKCMDAMETRGQRGWVFQFNDITYFITTFAPFYPDANARFAFGGNNGFILLQPELSFALHNLPPDTPFTNWDRPKTVRDRIRVAFRDAGREYEIPSSLFRPLAWDMVRPLQNGGPVVRWWQNTKED
ncbi:uncharacterized protein LOC110452419 isoform X2 [Mizuhopecten yessoensis]|uniref:uncharacterized protein LOC110452419 isoform X2 n=1 Tax=Mizuhopecten yessoensis TaxID=6573 RepID=UPI000B45DEE8|nr:uncharacterized protein LOC110452419 isoform X2 [Mizuhopecten yessoensis]